MVQMSVNSATGVFAQALFSHMTNAPFHIKVWTNLSYQGTFTGVAFVSELDFVDTYGGAWVGRSKDGFRSGLPTSIRDRVRGSIRSMYNDVILEAVKGQGPGRLNFYVVRDFVQSGANLSRMSTARKGSNGLVVGHPQKSLGTSIPAELVEGVIHEWIGGTSTVGNASAADLGARQRAIDLCGQFGWPAKKTIEAAKLARRERGWTPRLAFERIIQQRLLGFTPDQVMARLADP